MMKHINVTGEDKTAVIPAASENRVKLPCQSASKESGQNSQEVLCLPVFLGLKYLGRTSLHSVYNLDIESMN